MQRWVWFLLVGRSYYAAVGGGFSPYVKSRITDIIAQEKFDCQVKDLSQYSRTKEVCPASIIGFYFLYFK